MKTESEIILARAIAKTEISSERIIFADDWRNTPTAMRCVALNRTLESLYGKVIRKGALYAKGGAGLVAEALDNIRRTAESLVCVMHRIPGEDIDMTLNPIIIAIDSNVVHDETALLSEINKMINGKEEIALPYGSILAIEFGVRRNGRRESPYMTASVKDITKRLKEIAVRKTEDGEEMNGHGDTWLY